jgi:hypothetical protein
MYGTQMKQASKQVNNQYFKFWPIRVQTIFIASIPNLENVTMNCVVNVASKVLLRFLHLPR